MISFLTLIRRTSAALGAIAALTLTGNATAQTVSLSTGASCTYSSMTVTPNGNVVVSCGATATTYSVTAPSSLAANITTTTQVKVNRTGATTDAVDVGYSLTGPCTSAASSVNILAGSTSANLILDTGAASTTKCVVTLTPISGASMGSPASITIVDPDADVTFAFATATSNASVGSGAISIRINRGGGTNGTFTVPLTLSGTLAPGGTPLTGNLSALSLTFTPSDSFKTFTYTPPAVTPATPSLPAQMVVSFGTIVQVSGAAGQTGSGGTPHTMTLDGPGVGCPAPVTAGSLGAANTPFLLAMPNGDIKSYRLPTPTAGKSSGIFKLSSTSSSNPVAPWYYEVHINKCPGLVQAPPSGVKDTCYGSYANAAAVFSKYWFFKETSTYTQAKVKTAGYCWAPETEGPWYVNIRYNYAGCTTGMCGWSAQWTNFSY